jgi:hypothetical protein
VIDDLQGGMALKPGKEYPGDLAAGGIVRVQHTANRMGPFPRQVQFAGRPAVERRTPVDQLPHV